jgi:hypothetical protein
VHFSHWNFLIFLPLDPDPDPQSRWIWIQSGSGSGSPTLVRSSIICWEPEPRHFCGARAATGYCCVQASTEIKWYSPKLTIKNKIKLSRFLKQYLLLHAILYYTFHLATGSHVFPLNRHWHENSVSCFN